MPDESLHPGYFYPGEAVRLLGLEDLDYHQIRVLFRFIREQAGQLEAESGRRLWARFTVTDLACLAALIELCGGEKPFSRGGGSVWDLLAGRAPGCGM